VQSGITWEQIQEAINPYGLAIKVMQSSNIFTVGGSLSVNAHGRDIHYGPLIQTVVALKVLLEDGSIKWINRQHDKELFIHIIGGYGLFGIILEAELELTDNHLLTKSAKILKVEDYLTFFEKSVENDANIELHYARCYIGNDSPLKEVFAVSYKKTPNAEISYENLEHEKNIKINKKMLQLLRTTEWAKKALWKMEFLDTIFNQRFPNEISRNNAMRPPVICLEYDSPNDTDILQEYFVPKEHFLNFIHSMQNILARYPINLLNITIRYTKKELETVLSYAKEDSFAFVLYVNTGLSHDEQQVTSQWTQELIDAALDLNGTYYLPYQRYATSEQLYRSYKNIDPFLKKKKQCDPSNLFMNEFFKHILLNQ
jgi:decaprenylphospho-beta-D-ribofuranose 2-oxidase